MSGRPPDTEPGALERADGAPPPSVFVAAGGWDGLVALAGAWHERVMADEVVAHAFHDGPLPDHVERLAAYWAEALGGPPLYSERYGDETAVVRLHSGMGEHVELDDRAIACFDGALGDAGIADGDPLRAVLHDYFAWSTRARMSGYPGSAQDVPDGLAIPCWSWQGLSVGGHSPDERLQGGVSALGRSRDGEDRAWARRFSPGR